MYAYVMHDRIQDQRDAEEQEKASRDDWIDKETARLLALFPDDLVSFRGLFLPDEVREMTHASAAKELYHDFAWKLANNQAQQNYVLHDLGWRND